MEHFKVRCVRTPGGWFTVAFTEGKIYDVFNRVIIDDLGHSHGGVKDVDTLNMYFISKFELYTEEEIMTNFRVRCVRASGDWFTVGKIYNVIDGCLYDNNNDRYGYGYGFKDIYDINARLISQFELVNNIYEHGNDSVIVFRNVINSVYGLPRFVKMPAIQKVIFNDPATIVMWSDGTKTVVKAEHEYFDPEKGLAMAISKKALGNKGNYYEEFKKWLPEREDDEDPLIKLGKVISDGFSQALGKIETKENEDANVTGELKPSGVTITISEKSCDNCKYDFAGVALCAERNCHRVFPNYERHKHVDAWEPIIKEESKEDCSE